MVFKAPEFTITHSHVSTHTAAVVRYTATASAIVIERDLVRATQKPRYYWIISGTVVLASTVSGQCHVILRHVTDTILIQKDSCQLLIVFPTEF